MKTVVFTDYLRFRAGLRGFDLDAVGEIVLHSTERYEDTVSGRQVAVGPYGNGLALIPYEVDADAIIPVTVHMTSRQQIRYRLRSGRFRL